MAKCTFTNLTVNPQVRAFNGAMYLPGIVGLNNIKANDYCNVILQVKLKDMHVLCCENLFHEKRKSP